MITFKNFFEWAKRHLLLVTFITVAFVVILGFVNIQILHMTSEPEFCALCHPAQGTGPLAEVDSWEHSNHSKAGVSCLDCHGRPGMVGYITAKMGGLKDAYMQLAISPEEKLDVLSNPPEDLVPAAHCLFCHSDEGNRKVREATKGPLRIVKMRMLDDVVNPQFRERKGLPDILQDDFVGGSHFNHSMHIESFDFVCRDCHFGVVHNPSTKTDRMNFCIGCHADFPDDAPQMADCVVCHEAQLDMNKGIGAKGVAGNPGLMWGAGIVCTDCHTGVTKGVYRPSSSTCTDCHGDEGYEAIFTDWEQTTSKRVKELREFRLTVEHALDDAEHDKRDVEPLWERFEIAQNNLEFVRNDGTKGVHNIEYSEAILNSVDSEFKQIMRDLNRSW